ncbi:FAD-dependent oxidoreductase [Subtercola sp. YIM 133946]|uniref:FAD-dependent oxidoreductase n=1 Tax=Subtercola sp. YIM 133946 TaxID=3118909 RepID=UPI002F948FF7
MRPTSRAEAGHPLGRTFTPWRLGGVEVPHRVVMGSMHTGLELADDGGAALAAFWRERIQGGAALIITGGLAVSPEGRGAADYAVLGEAATDARLAVAVDAVHAAGGLVSAQLFHAGRYALLDGLQGADAHPLQQVAPSAVPWRAARGAVPQELTELEIWRVIGDYGRAAQTAARLGFDAVEIMASEGYLINQFCSPLTNLRDDAWGGDAARRRRFALEVLSAVRSAVGSAAAVEERASRGGRADEPGESVDRRAADGGDAARGAAVGAAVGVPVGAAVGVPVGVRVSGDDLMPGSSTPDEVDALVRELVAGGADAISVGVGWHESRVPTVQASVPHGAWLPYAERIAAVVRASVGGGVGAGAAGRHVAVIASNRMTDLRDVERVLAGGLVDAVALARPFLADPSIVARSRAGEFDAVNTCIGCNQACIDRSLVGQHVSCLVNPRAGYESVRALALTRRPVRLAVVGGGPAGLAAAVDAARRGHQVTLFEAADAPGGQFGLAARIPGKEDYAATPRAALAELRARRATLRFGAPATPRDLVGAAFDAVIVASGVRPREIDVPGGALPHVVSYEHALRHGVPAGPVAIIGGGGIGVDVAAWLTEPAAEADRAPEFARVHHLVPSPALVGTSSAAARQWLEAERPTPAQHAPSAELLPSAEHATSTAPPQRNLAPLRGRPVPRAGELVTVLRRAGRFGDGIGISSRWVAVGRLREAGVRMIGGVRYERITPTAVEVVDVEGVRQSIRADTVIVCAGQERNDDLVAALEASGMQFEVVGGAKDARGVDAVRATAEGLAAARRLAP